MKFGFFVSCLLLSAAAMAKVDGISCKMEYKSSSVLSTHDSLSSNRWLVAGDEMEGTAIRADGKGGWGSTPANFIKVSSTKTGKQPFWKISVLDADKNLVGDFSFKEDAAYSGTASGAKIILPVEAYAEGDEDPPRYDTLEVTCYNTIFAG